MAVDSQWASFRRSDFYFNPAPGWPEPSQDWKPDPTTEWIPPSAWPPLPEHWPLFVWSDGHDQHGRSPTPPPSALDHRPAGVATGLGVAVASAALVYCGITLLTMTTTQRALFDGSSFIPPFVAIFPIWLWVVLVVGSKRSVSRRGRKKLLGRPLAPSRPLSAKGLIVTVAVVGPVVAALTLLCHLGSPVPAGQPGSNPAMNQYWFDDHGSIRYVSKGEWEKGAIGWDESFTQAAVLFNGTALAVLWSELRRRKGVRTAGGNLPWL